MAKMFGKEIFDSEAKLVSEAIGEGISEGHKKKRIAVASMNEADRAEFDLLEKKIAELKYDLDSMLIPAYERCGLSLPIRLQRKE